MLGTAYVPLFELCRGVAIWDKFAIKDFNGNINGMMEVKITLHNSIEEVNMPHLQRTEITASSFEKEFLFKICYRYAGMDNIDVDALYSIFSKGEDNITKDNFRNSIIPKKCGVSPTEVDQFIRDCEPFHRRGYMNREEFISLFKGPLKRAIQEERIRKEALGIKDDESKHEEDDLKRATSRSYKPSSDASDK
jgi:hypothetical protein